MTSGSYHALALAARRVSDGWDALLRSSVNLDTIANAGGDSAVHEAPARFLLGEFLALVFGHEPISSTLEEACDWSKPKWEEWRQKFGPTSVGDSDAWHKNYADKTYFAVVNYWNGILIPGTGVQGGDRIYAGWVNPRYSAMKSSWQTVWEEYQDKAVAAGSNFPSQPFATINDYLHRLANRKVVIEWCFGAGQHSDHELALRAPFITPSILSEIREWERPIDFASYHNELERINLWVEQSSTFSPNSSAATSEYVFPRDEIPLRHALRKLRQASHKSLDAHVALSEETSRYFARLAIYLNTRLGNNGSRESTLSLETCQWMAAQLLDYYGPTGSLFKGINCKDWYFYSVPLYVPGPNEQGQTVRCSIFSMAISRRLDSVETTLFRALGERLVLPAMAIDLRRRIQQAERVHMELSAAQEKARMFNAVEGVLDRIVEQVEDVSKSVSQIRSVIHPSGNQFWNLGSHPDIVKLFMPGEPVSEDDDRAVHEASDLDSRPAGLWNKYRIKIKEIADEVRSHDEASARFLDSVSSYETDGNKDREKRAFQLLKSLTIDTVNDQSAVNLFRIKPIQVLAMLHLGRRTLQEFSRDINFDVEIKYNQSEIENEDSRENNAVEWLIEHPLNVFSTEKTLRPGQIHGTRAADVLVALYELAFVLVAPQPLNFDYVNFKDDIVYARSATILIGETSFSLELACDNSFTNQMAEDMAELEPQRKRLSKTLSALAKAVGVETSLPVAIRLPNDVAFNYDCEHFLHPWVIVTIERDETTETRIRIKFDMERR